MNFSNCQQLVRTEQSLTAGGQSVNSGDDHVPAGLWAHSVLKVLVSFLLSLLYSFLVGSLRLCPSQVVSVTTL